MDFEKYKRTKLWAQKFQDAHDVCDVEVMTAAGIHPTLAAAYKESLLIQHQELKDQANRFEAVVNAANIIGDGE